MPTNEDLIITSARVMQHESRLNLLDEALQRIAQLEGRLLSLEAAMSELRGMFFSDRSTRDEKVLAILESLSATKTPV